jgi:beta-N-acetylhexosaminidase
MLTRIGYALLACVAMLTLAGMLTGQDADPIEPTSAAAKAGTPPPAPLATVVATPAPGTPAPELAPAATKRMPIADAVGQRIVTGYHGAAPPASILRAVRAGKVGGVILFGENVLSVGAARSAIRSLERAAAAGHRPALLIMIDQEGGDIRRLATLPPRLSPAQMGAAAGPAATAEHQGRITGAALRRLGINVNLAPVADVSMGASSFLGERAFSRRAGVVARAACGFAAGLSSEAVAGTLKHFPGLGRAPGNTDLRSVQVSANKGRIEADLAAYRRCGKAVPMVMLSSASYPALGIRGPAVLDGRTYRLLSSTGFRGITITDAFDTPALSGRTRPARSALQAGVDLLLYGSNEAGAQQAYARLLEDAKAGRLPPEALRAKAERVVAFKRRLAAGNLDGAGR